GLDGANAIWREVGNDTMLASGLFNQALVLHEAGDQARAARLLEESLRLRSAHFGSDHGVVGATLRLAGEVDAARGHDAQALAEFEATHATPGALARLDHLAALPATNTALRKIAWRAQATAAALRCGGPRREESLALFTALEQQMAMARPEGGVVVREVRH